MYSRLACFALSCLLVGGVAVGQPADSVPGYPRWYFEIVTASPPVDFTTPTAGQYLQNLHAVGRQDLHAALPNRIVRPAPCEPWPSRPDRAPQSIAAELAVLARDTTVVIINEAHDESRHREVVRQLAVELRREGYLYYAAETLREAAASHPDEPFARLDAGHYSLEPSFGQLLRAVKELGYRPVAYEHDGNTSPGDATNLQAEMARREQGQTDNLLRKIFTAEPQAKTLIHVGYSHAAEVALPNFGGSLEWMAARLKAATGIDPLTIDQVRCASATNAIELARVAESLPAGAHDVAVAHPPTTLFRGRPQWQIDAGAIPIELPETLVVDDVRTLIEARYDSEPPDAIPLDRLLLGPGERLPLLLRPGSIRVTQSFEDERPTRSLVLVVR